MTFFNDNPIHALSVLLDDNVGHWQVMPHPSRNGWTRLLYSCKVKLLLWIPEFVVNAITAQALTEVSEKS